VPTYQYACTACGHNLEAVQSFTDDPLTECPECAGRLRKVYGSVGIVFKGSGFYRTDSRNGSNGGSVPKKDTPKTDAPKSESTKSADSSSSSSSSSSTSTPSTSSSSTSPASS
jgi:putative FmdB family regulatory protein